MNILTTFYTWVFSPGVMQEVIDNAVVLSPGVMQEVRNRSCHRAS